MITRKVAVSPVTPKIKFLVKSKSENNGISKTLRYIFVFFQIVFALDNGFIQASTKRKKWLLKLAALLQSLIIFVFCNYTLYPFSEENTFFYVIDILMYLMFVIVTLCCTYSYYDFQNDLRSFDKEINADNVNYRLDLKITAVLTIIVTYMVLKYMLFINYAPESKVVKCYNTILYLICLLGVDFVRIIYIFVFSSTCWRIKKFIRLVRNDNVDVIVCQYLYKNIVDITEKAKANFNFTFIATLIFNTVTTTIILFLPFAKGTVKSEPLWRVMTNILSVLKNLLVMLAPTFTAGLLSSEVEKLVLALRDKVLVAKDEKQVRDLKRFIGYVEARPLKFSICSVVPLDWHLPVIVVNMSFTYLIVMIQFTHNY